MAIIALDVNATREFSLKADQGPDKTVFEIGLLDAPLRAYIEDKVMAFSVNPSGASSDPAAVNLNTNRRDIEVLKFGLRGWRNFRNLQGGDVKFERISESVPGVGNRYVVSGECLRYLDIEWIKEIAKAIIGDNFLTDDDKKK